MNFFNNLATNTDYLQNSLQNSLSGLPGMSGIDFGRLAAAINNNSQLGFNNGEDPQTFANNVNQFISSQQTNPSSFYTSVLSGLGTDYASGGNPQSITNAVQGLSTVAEQAGVSPGQINSAIQNAATNYNELVAQSNQSSSGGFFGSLATVLSNPTTVLEIAAAASIPGAAEALAPSIAAGLGVSAATATAIAAGTLSASVQVAAGVPVNEAIQNAAVGTIVSTGTTEAAQSIISNNPGTSVATVLSTPVPGAAAGSLSPVVSAVSQGLSSGISAELTGKNVAQAIEKGAAIGGISSAAAQEASALTSSGTTKSTGLSYQTVTDPTTGAQTEYFPGLGGMSKVNVSGDPMIPAGTGVGLIGSRSEAFPNFNPAYTTPDTTPMTIGPDGSLIPAYQSAESAILPPELQQYLPVGSETPAEQVVTETITPGLSKAAQDALQTTFGFGLGLIGPKSQPSFGVPADTGASTAAKTGSTSSTTGGGPGGTELDPSTGKAPQQVWGEDYKSLKEGLNV